MDTAPDLGREGAAGAGSGVKGPGCRPRTDAWVRSCGRAPTAAACAYGGCCGLTMAQRSMSYEAQYQE